MEDKLTVKEFIRLTDVSIAKEVYAKLVALRMDYEIKSSNGKFEPAEFERLYHIALSTINEMKLSKLQLIYATINQSNELERIGFTKQDLLNLVGLDIA